MKTLRLRGSVATVLAVQTPRLRASVVILLAAWCLAIGAAPAGAQTPAPSSDAKTGTIRGRITSADTGRPVRRALVTIRSASSTAGNRPLTANTNSQGQFEAKDLPAGSYYVGAGRAGYLTLQYGQRRVGETGLAIDVRAGGVVERIDVALPPGSVISGRITDDLGEPYPGVRVDVLRLRYDRGQRVPSIESGGTTDDLGQFRIAGLQPGSYYVSATSSETWITEKKETYGYASTYFPGGAPDLAQPIALAASEHRRDVNFSLHASRAVRISGRLQRESGEPMAGAQVSLAYSYGGAIVVAGGRLVRTEADGAFEFRDVAAGKYRLSSYGEILVGTADIGNLVLVSKTGSTVTGTVVADNDTAPPFPAAGIRILIEAPTDQPVLPTVRVRAVEPDWSFKLMSLGGPFVFRLMGLPEGWMVSRVRLGDRDITDVPWDVPTGGREFSGLTITVTDKVAKLSGTVVDSKGAPSSAATVVVFPEDAELWIPSSRFIRTTRPGNGGEFSVPGLPPGIYRAIAREYVETGQWEDRKFLESVRDEAVRVVLGEGAAESVTLKLPQAK